MHDSDDNNDLSQPLDGDIANHLAKLITSLTETDIASLAEAMLSLLPKAEKDRLLASFLEPYFCRLIEGLSIELSNTFTDFGQRLYREVLVPYFTYCFYGSYYSSISFLLTLIFLTSIVQLLIHDFFFFFKVSLA